MAGFGTAPSQDTILAAQIQNKLILQSHMKAGASWFFWIAGLSIINSVISMSGSQWHFIAGLGITDVVDFIAKRFGSGGTVVGIMLDAFVAGMFVLFGIFAGKRQTWAFIVGMTFYGLDALIFILGQFWLGIAFHIYVLYRIWAGMKAANQLGDLERSMPQTIVAG